MPAMGVVKHDLDEVAVKLGSTGECPEAFIRPRVGDKPDWDVSYLASLFLADQIRHLLRLRESASQTQIAHKTLLVDGKVYDACDQADSIGLDHYKRASLSHGAAISDAMIKRFGKVAVVEDDSTSPVGAHAVRLAPTDLHGFAQAWREKTGASFAWVGGSLPSRWTLDGVPAGVQVRRANLEAVLRVQRWLRSALQRLAIISERYYRWTVDKLISGGTIDYDVLPRAPGVLLTIPVLSAQKRLDINIEHQAAVSDLFASGASSGRFPRSSRATRRSQRRNSSKSTSEIRSRGDRTAERTGRRRAPRGQRRGKRRTRVHGGVAQRDREDRRRRGRGG